jgi:uncharacterized protein
MHFLLRAVVGLMLGGLVMQGSTVAQTVPNQVDSVRLGTATPGGGFPVYGDAFVAALKVADPTLIVVPQNTKGSVENIALLERGALDIALVQGESAYEALNGINRPRADLRVLTAMYSSPGIFVVKAQSPVRTIQDLKGKPVAFGAAGSGLVILARYVLDGLDLDLQRDFQAVLLERAGDGPQMVEDGRVAALWGGGLGWPGFTAVAKLPGGARFIVPSADEVQRIQRKHPFLMTLIIPAGTYPGQDQTLTSVGSWNFVLVRPDLDEATAYRLAKALHGAEAELARRLPLASETTATNTSAAVARPELLHPGVARYLREIGLLK